jgi:hypothetical protein
VDEDALILWRESGENRMQLSTYTPTHCAISLNARISTNVLLAIDKYVGEMGFEGPKKHPQ